MNLDLATLTSRKIKSLQSAELSELARQIRSFLIENISKTGGHIGANLGVIELTIAIHAVFESPIDTIIFDTGHQGYTHKLITGRHDMFPSLNSRGGMSRFLSRQESEHDPIEASHAGTSLSISSGFAWAMKGQALNRRVVAVIGDGSMVEGMAFEGLNFVAGVDLPLVVILNDNEMAIASSVGGIRNVTTGDDWIQKSKAFFEGLGLQYIPVVDGHDISSLMDAMTTAKASSRTVLIHAKTQKGRGLECAKGHPYKMHFSMPFDPASGKGASPTVAGKAMGSVASEELERILERDRDVYIITPATPYASYLDNLIVRFPDRVVDVGMAEQQAVGMAVGLALAGKKPVVCIQTTFMQRAFDQLLHDVCYMRANVTILGVRSGFSGYDSPTHHGLFDIPYLRSFPNLTIVYPTDSHDMRALLNARMEAPQGPLVILHPYEPIEEPELRSTPDECSDVFVVAEGEDGIIFTLGNRAKAAAELRAFLKVKQGRDFGLAVVRQIKPFPVAVVLDLCSRTKRVVTLEESTLPGGFGSLIGEVLLDANQHSSLLRCGVDDCFVSPGTKLECSDEAGIDTDSLAARIAGFWPVA